MYPHPILGIDPFIAILSVICIFGTALFVYLIRDAGYSIRQLLSLQLCIVISGLIGAKIFSLYIRGWEFFPSWKHEVVSGWRYPGAVVGFFILLPLLKRLLAPQVSLLRCGDASVIATAFCLGIFRVSCILNGCCTGEVGHGAYCWSYARSSAAWFWQMKAGLIGAAAERSLPVVPLHLYFMLASFVVGFLLLKYRRYKRFDGELILWFLLLHEGSKALLENFRVPYIRELQLVSIGVAALAAVALIACYALMPRGSRAVEEAQ